MNPNTFYTRTLTQKNLLRVTLDDHSMAKTASSAGGEEGELAVLLVQTVGRLGNETGTSGTEGVTNGEGTTPKVELVHGDIANLALAHVGLAELLRAHGLHVGEDLTGKGLVVLEDGDVLEGKASTGKHLGGGVGRAKEELLLGVVTDVHKLTEVSLGLEAKGKSLLLRHDEGSRCTVSQERGVGGGDGTMRLNEGRLKSAELLNGADTNTVVSADGGALAGDGHRDDVGEVALLGGLVGHDVRAESKLILLTTGHTERGGEAVSTVAHGLTGGELGNSGELRGEMSKLDLGEKAKVASRALDLAGSKESLTEGLGKTDGNVGHSLDTTSDNNIGSASLNETNGLGGSLVGRDARHGDSVGRDLVTKTSRQGGLTGDVGGLNLLDHSAHDDVLNLTGANAGSLKETLKGKTAQVMGHKVLVVRARGKERSTDTIDQHDISGLVLLLGRSSSVSALNAGTSGHRGSNGRARGGNSLTNKCGHFVIKSKSRKSMVEIPSTG
eukprot:Colp12_sorted_trinity150504_noHs@28031